MANSDGAGRPGRQAEPAPTAEPAAATAARPLTLTLRLAAVASGVECVAAGSFAAVVLVGAFGSRRTLPLGPVLGLGAVFALFAAALAIAAVGLWRNNRRPRSFAVVMHGLVVLVGLGFFPAGWPYGLAFLVVGGGGLAALFARATSRSLGQGRLPGT